MGRMEEASRKRTRRNQLRGLILGSVEAAGLIGLAIVAPNVIGAMDRLGLIPSRQQSGVIRASAKRLVKQGLLSWEHGKLRLTKTGQAELRRLTIAERASARPRRWDKKWRLLIFDIPERRAYLRKRIRYTLRSIGFERLQDSVWIYPYDCEDLVALLKADFKVGRAMLYLIVDQLEFEGDVRKLFRLPPLRP